MTTASSLITLASAIARAPAAMHTEIVTTIAALDASSDARMIDLIIEAATAGWEARDSLWSEEAEESGLEDDYSDAMWREDRVAMLRGQDEPLSDDDLDLLHGTAVAGWKAHRDNN
jgi:hypothetical protein